MLVLNRVDVSSLLICIAIRVECRTEKKKVDVSPLAFKARHCLLRLFRFAKMDLDANHNEMG